MPDNKISDYVVETAPPPPTDFLVVAVPDVINKKVPVSMVLFKQEVISADADKAMSVGINHIVDISAWVSDNIFSLPTTAKVGERIRIQVDSGSSTYKLQLRTTAASNDTINGIDHDSSDGSSLFNAGEFIVFRCITADTDWIVEQDGRIPCVAGYNGASPGVLTATWTPIDLSALTSTMNQGAMADLTNDKFVVRRAGLYGIRGGAYTSSFNLDAEQPLILRVELDTGGGFAAEYPLTWQEPDNANESIGITTGKHIYDSAIGDAFRLVVYQASGATQSVNTDVTVTEILAR